jgi:probable H4MPT-linked C1 transfer pathway protein
MSVLAVDIGGANIKLASSAGPAWTVPFALWQQPEVVASQLMGELEPQAPELVLVTMTAELCDCFATRAEGVRFILEHVEAAAGPAAVRVWATDRGFLPLEQARAAPAHVAAGNWHALGIWLAPLFSAGLSLSIDIGSTTTDLIPLREGGLATDSRTDPQRLARGELVYLGAGRTPLMSLGGTVSLDGQTFGTMAEHFATLADALVLAGDLSEAPHSKATADERPLTADAAAVRVLRMIGGDRDTFSHAAAVHMAQQYRARALERLRTASRSVLGDAAPDRIILSGTGTPLGRALAEEAWPEARHIILADKIGPEASAAACAYALLRLWEKEAADV